MVLVLLLSLLFFLLLLHEDLLELGSLGDVSEMSLPHDSSLLHHDDLIHCLCKLDSVGGHDDSLAFQVP